MAGPLDGIIVIELAGIGPGPFAGMLLADLGADVIRIDRIPVGQEDQLSAALRNDSLVDRGRRSIALDLKDPRGVEILLQLVASADALIEGYRPGVAEKLGFGPEACHARNPRLVYGRMTGWGQSGPLALTAGHDLNYIALSGALHAMGEADRPPTPPLNLVGDYGGGGMLLALGMLSAVIAAVRTGQGQVVDAAMVDGSALLMSAIYGLRAKGFWGDARESNMLDGGAPFYACYECADGAFISVAAIEPQFYKQLLQRCEITDPMFSRQWDRALWPVMKEKLAALFRSRTRADWCERLEGSDACFAPVLSMTEAPAHDHCKHRGVFIEVDGVVQPAPAPRFDRTPIKVPPPAPQIGQDTVALLQSIGHDSAQIDGLINAGVVHQCASV